MLSLFQKICNKCFKFQYAIQRKNNVNRVVYTYITDDKVVTRKSVFNRYGVNIARDDEYEVFPLTFKWEETYDSFYKSSYMTLDISKLQAWLDESEIKPAGFIVDRRNDVINIKFQNNEDKILFDLKWID